MTPLALVIGFALSGLLMVAATLAGLSRVDESWRSYHRTCCVCRRDWTGREKFCRCGARGHTDPPVTVRTPAVDWQGRCDTGPIPVVRIPEQRPAPDAEHVDPATTARRTP